MKKSEQLLKYSRDIENSTLIKELDVIYNSIMFSNLNNTMVFILNSLINLKYENLMLGGNTKCV